MRFCSPGNFSLVRIGDKITCVPESNTITLCNSSWYCSDYSWLCAWCLCETAAVGNSGLCEAWESLGDLADISPQQTAQLSGVCRVGTWAPLYLSQESPCCCHPSRSRGCLGCYTRSRWGCLAQLQHFSWCNGSFLFSLQSSEEVLQGHARLQGKFLSPAGSCCCKLPFFCIPLRSVCAGGGAVGWLAMGCGSTAD